MQSATETESYHPPREIEILRPFNIQGEKGETLTAGNRYVLPYQLAISIVESGRAIDVQTGKRVDRRTAPAPAPRPTWTHSRPVRIKGPGGIRLDGRILNAGEEHQYPVELLPDDRVELLDVKPRPRPKREFKGEPHLVRIVVASPTPGAGVRSVFLDRHVDHGEMVTLPDEEAQALIASGSAVSLRPEMPDPDVDEFVELFAGSNEKKKASAKRLAQRLIRQR